MAIEHLPYQSAPGFICILCWFLGGCGFGVFFLMDILFKIKTQVSLDVIFLASQVTNPWKKVFLMERLSTP